MRRFLGLSLERTGLIQKDLAEALRTSDRASEGETDFSRAQTFTPGKSRRTVGGTPKPQVVIFRIDIVEVDPVRSECLSRVDCAIVRPVVRLHRRLPGDGESLQAASLT